MNNVTKPTSLWRNVISVILSFIQSLFLVLLAACIGLFVVLSPSFTVNMIKETNYVNLAFDEMKKDLNDLAIPSGLPQNFFSETFTEKDLLEFEERLVLKASSSISQKEYNIDTNQIKLKFKTLIKDYAKEVLGLSESVSDEAISVFVNECTTTYLQFLSPSIFNLAFKYFKPIVKIIRVISIVTFLLLVAVFIFLFKLCDRKKLYFYSFSSFAASGLILGLIPSYLLITKSMSKINISLASLYNFVSSYLSTALTVFLITSGILILISFVFLILEFVPFPIKKQPE